MHLVDDERVIASARSHGESRWPRLEQGKRSHSDDRAKTDQAVRGMVVHDRGTPGFTRGTPLVFLLIPVR